MRRLELLSLLVLPLPLAPTLTESLTLALTEVLGPVLFASYLFVVLFTAFTLIIALITDAYEKVKEPDLPLPLTVALPKEDAHPYPRTMQCRKGLAITSQSRFLARSCPNLLTMT